MDPAKIHILVLDRDPAAARAIRDTLDPLGYQVSIASDEPEALVLAEEKLFNLVVKSFDAQRIDAIALMDKIRGVTPDTQFIFVSDKGTIRTAVDAIRKGAFDYLSKPIKADQLVESVRKALDYQALVAEDQRLKLRLRRRSEPDIFAGKSTAMQEINQLIQQIAATEVTVLIEGESGTGKEIIARAIHERSRRSARPFIAVNCAALPDNLIEAEFFGHVRGAFTGAIGDRQGRFQLAHGGTLFLDEIGDLSPKGQGDLLRVLEDGIFRPVGSHKVERADARIIAATNKNLEAEGINGRVSRRPLLPAEHHHDSHPAAAGASRRHPNAREIVRGAFLRQAPPPPEEVQPRSGRILPDASLAGQRAAIAQPHRTIGRHRSSKRDRHG